MIEFSGKVSSVRSKPTDEYIVELEEQLYIEAKKAYRRGGLLKRLIDSGMLTTNEKLMCQEECEDCDLTREIIKELADAKS